MRLSLPVKVVALLAWSLRGLGAADDAPPKMELVTEGLPEVEDLLQQLELSHLKDKFFESGFTETKYILRMKAMDLRIMGMEWGLDKEQVERVRSTIKELKVEREVVQVKDDPLLKLRNSLTYGRLVLNHSTASFEYFTGYFSSAVPVGSLDVVLADPFDACAVADPSLWAGKAVVAERGGCTFLDKANNASSANVSALIVVNNESTLFRIAAGYATGATITDEAEIQVPKDLPIVMVKNFLEPAVRQAKSQVVGQLVPLKCTPGSPGCHPVLPAEKDVVFEVDSGILEVSAGPSQVPSSFEFLTGTWSGILPDGPLRVLHAEPADACTALTNPAALVRDALVLVQRGGCSFGDKALTVQAAGGAVVAIVDTTSGALQRIGATEAQLTQISIPGLLLTKTAGSAIRTLAQGSSKPTAQIRPKPGMAEAWLELALTEWPEDPDERLVVYRRLQQQNMASDARVAWLQEQAAGWFDGSGEL